MICFAPHIENIAAQGQQSPIRKEKGIDTETQAPMTLDEYREREFDRIADIVRASVDMDAIYRIVRGEV